MRMKEWIWIKQLLRLLKGQDADSFSAATTIAPYLSRDHLPIVPIHGDDLRLQLDRHDSLGLLQRPFEPDEVSLVKRVIKPGQVVLDIGANIGYYTLLFSRLVGDAGKVIAFEPDPDNAALLIQNLAANQCQNVTVHQVATGARQAILRLYQCAENAGMHRAYNSICCTTDYRSVTSVAIDQFLENESQIDFLKMDIEGYEYFALQGMQAILEEKAPKILVEFSPFALAEAGVTTTAFIEFFAKRNYTISSVRGEGTDGVIPRNFGDLFERAAVFDSHADVLRQQARCETVTEFGHFLEATFAAIGHPFDILDSWLCERQLQT